jgi:phage baseplate assembly protein W
MTYQLKLPIKASSELGFEHEKSLLGSIKQDFVNLLLVNEGEKINEPDFGVGLLKYVFEFDTPVYRDDIFFEIDKKVKKFMPFITISNVVFLSEDSTLYIKIEYVLLCFVLAFFLLQEIINK